MSQKDRARERGHDKQPTSKGQGEFCFGCTSHNLSHLGERKKISEIDRERNKLLDQIERYPQDVRDEFKTNLQEVLNRRKLPERTPDCTITDTRRSFREYAKSLLREKSSSLDAKIISRKVPDEQLFVRLAALGRVSAGAESLREGVSDMIEVEWRIDVKPKLFDQLKPLARASSELFECLTKLNNFGMDALWEAFLTNQDYAADEKRIALACQLAELRMLTEGLAILASSALQPEERRSRQAMKNTQAGLKRLAPGSLSGFTLQLLWEMRFAGGKLTLDKNRRKGTLAEALKLLRPYLPARFIPQELPFSTLGRIKSLDQKIALTLAVQP